MKAYNLELDGIDTRDYPDFCDAFICYAEHEDGTPFTDEELDDLNDDRELIHEAVWKHLF